MNRFTIIITGIILCLSGRIYAAQVRIATYNVENLFDTHYQGTEYPRYIPSPKGWNAKVYRTKLEHIAEVLCDLDADIVGLQEVESARALEDLRAVLKRVGCRYAHAAITNKAGAAVQVALLSRYPIVRSRTLHLGYASGIRPMLEVLVDTPHEPLRVFVNHWKSRAREGWESKRIAYAKRLMKRLKQIDWGRPFVVLGDLNSDYHAYLSLEPRLNDTQGRTAINSVLPTMKAGRPVQESDMTHRGAKVLYNLWYELPRRLRWSQRFFGARSTPDHILLSPALFDGKGLDYRNNSFKVFKADYLFTAKGYVNRWEIKHGKHTGKGYSDHLPLVATLETAPYRPSPQDRDETPPYRVTIDDFYEGNATQAGVYRLDNTAVVYRHGLVTLLKQSQAKRGIMLYGRASSLYAGECYDMYVEGPKRYKGLLEVTAAYPIKNRGKCDVRRFVHEGNGYIRHGALPNEVVANVRGIYRGRYLYLDGGGRIRLYFKKRSLKPAYGSRIIIDYARIGYYKGAEIVIESKKNFHTE